MVLANRLITLCIFRVGCTAGALQRLYLLDKLNDNPLFLAVNHISDDLLDAVHFVLDEVVIGEEGKGLIHSHKLVEIG